MWTYVFRRVPREPFPRNTRLDKLDQNSCEKIFFQLPSEYFSCGNCDKHNPSVLNYN